MKDKKLRHFVTLLIIALLVSGLIVPQSPNVYGANPKKKLSEIRRKLKSKKARIKETIQEEKSVLSKIQTIDKRIRNQEKKLKKIDRSISEAQLQILSMSKDTNSLTKKMEKQKTYLEKRLRAMYKQHYGGYALILFTANDRQDLIRKSKYISLAVYHDQKIIKSYKNKLDEIASLKKNLEVQRVHLEKNRKSATAAKNTLKTDRARKDKLLITIRSKRSTYEKAIKELEESSKRLQEMIKKLEKKKIPKEIIGRGFRSLKGRLSWPINGKVVIPYGPYKDPKFNISMFKNGIEIRAKRESLPKAVAGGRIVYADWFKGYGLLLIINHGSGYHSLYGNLSEIFHDTGDIINKGTAVGKTGLSSLLNVPTLYFEIRYKGKPDNPMKWLQRRSVRKKKL